MHVATGLCPLNVYCVEHGLKLNTGPRRWICLPCEAEEAENIEYVRRNPKVDE